MKSVDRKHLAMALSRIPDPPEPETMREQVRTPGDLAADFLLLAQAAGDLEGKNVVDLGAGTGVLGIGALILGARRVVGVEVEPRLVEIAKQVARDTGVSDDYEAITGDVSRLAPCTVTDVLGAGADTVVMNPPFGADRRSRAAGGDRVFLSLAFSLAPCVWSMHLASTEPFLRAYARDAGYGYEAVRTVEFPLPARFAHHKAQRLTKQVVWARFVKSDRS